MNEDDAERIAERRMDRLDREFLADRITREEYDRKVKEIDEYDRLGIRRY